MIQKIVAIDNQYKIYELKLDSHLPKRNYFICFDESPFKIMKNAFDFILF